MKKADKIIDLCSGNGVVALLLTEKVKNFKKIYEVEVQEEVAEMAKRSIELNELEEKITVINKNLKDLKDAAILHDFGKVLIPPEILNKHGKLTDEEHKIMDLHSIIGYEMLKNSGVNDEVLKLVRFHHNNFEEKGAKRDYIPDINLQILNIADKYSALTEKRVYKEALTPKQALTIIYSDVKKGNVHPFLFQALVKAVTPPQPAKIYN